MDFTFTTQLHYLVHQVEGESEFVAHCLDMDLVGTGKDVNQAVAQLNGLVRAVVFYCLKAGIKDTSAHCSKAPRNYWDMFKCAQNEHGSEIRTLDVAPELAPISVIECHFTYCLAIAA
jgi:hypothetical protein